MSCYDPLARYRPQWAYLTPPGFRDHVFVVGPFQFSLPAGGGLTQNLPVQLDDDVPFIIRGIFLSPVVGTIITNSTGMFARIRDAYGNPLTDGLVLGLGVWTNQENEVNGWGFPIEQEVECPPGGTLLFDFQSSTNGGTAATATHADGGESVTFTAAVMGTGGNGFHIAMVNPGAANVPLSVAVVGTSVTVTLATNGASALITTYLQLFNLINNAAAVQPVLFATLTGSAPSTVVSAMASTPLGGGGNGTAPLVFNGSLMGVKRFEDCPE